MTGSPPRVLVHVTDLIFETKIRTTARSAGCDVAFVSTAQALAGRLRDGGVSLVIVDLNVAGGDAIQSIEVATRHASTPRVLAFVSHVDEALAQRAQAAGADDVLPRSRFSAQLPELLVRHAGSPHFADRLVAAIRRTQAAVCVGLDPVLERLPTDLLADCGIDGPGKPGASTSVGTDAAARAILQFGKEVIQVVTSHVPAVKINIAFFEPYQEAGLCAYRELIQVAQQAGLLVIGDVKRGDIDHSAQQYAAAHVTSLAGFATPDAVTLNGYLGFDGVRPFIEAARPLGKGAFVLVQTSNPSAAAVQQLRDADGTTVSEHLGRLVHRWSVQENLIGPGGYSCLGAVVAPVDEETTRRLRELMPQSIFLVPGFGAQGRSADQVALCFRGDGTGAIVNASRSVIFAYETPGYRERFGADWRRCIEAGCQDFVTAIRAVSTQPSAG